MIGQENFVRKMSHTISCVKHFFILNIDCCIFATVVFLQLTYFTSIHKN